MYRSPIRRRSLTYERPRALCPVMFAVAWLLVVMGFLPAPAWAQDWEYRVRLDDTLSEIVAEYVKPEFGWRRVADYNNLADTDFLLPGSTVRLPVGWLRVQPAKARVANVHGEAFGQYADDDEPFALTVGSKLGVGAALTTADESSLTLEFADGSTLLVQSDARLVLDTLSAYGATGMVDTRLRLRQGRAGGRVRPAEGAASRFEVRTPAAVTSVRGTDFRVAVGDDEHFLAEVTAGAVAVHGGGKEVSVPKGYGTFVESVGAPPAEPVTLLPAPELDALPATFGGGPADLHWSPVENARGYRVQIAPDTRFRTLLVDRITDAPGARVAGLPDGMFALRVRAIDAHGLEGFDAQQEFTLAKRPCQACKVLAGAAMVVVILILL